MILAKVRLEFSDGRWNVSNGSSESVRRMFERVTAKGESKVEKSVKLERMSLGSLLYHTLMGEGAQG